MQGKMMTKQKSDEELFNEAVQLLTARIEAWEAYHKRDGRKKFVEDLGLLKTIIEGTRYLQARGENND